jgi:antirestriction protein ArdC
MRSKTCCSMAELRGLHAPLAAFLHIIDTSRLLKVLRGDKRAIFSAAAQAQRAADWMHEQQPDAAEIAEMKECNIKQHNAVSAACPPAAARVRP